MGEETVPELGPAPEEAFGLEDGREPALPVATPEPQRNRWTWVWSSLLGAVLGGILGLVLALLVFVGINGTPDVRRSTVLKALDKGQSGLGVEIDAARSDVEPYKAMSIFRARGRGVPYSYFRPGGSAESADHIPGRDRHHEVQKKDEAGLNAGDLCRQACAC